MDEVARQRRARCEAAVRCVRALGVLWAQVRIRGIAALIQRYDRQQAVCGQNASGPTVDYNDGVTRFRYDAGGRRVAKEYPNGTTTTYEYNQADQVTAIVTWSPDEDILWAKRYSWDAAGRITEIVREDGSVWSYGYNARGELTSAVKEDKDGQVLRSYNYTYDAVGNRTEKVVDGVSTTYEYNALDQLVRSVTEAEGETTYEYDGRGNLVAEHGPEGTTSYEYDARNKLVKVTEPDGSVHRNWYGPDGRRHRVKAPGEAPEVHELDGEVVVNRYDEASGERERSIVHGPVIDEQISQETASGESRYVHQDHLQSVGALTGENGQLTDSFEYSPYGMPLSGDLSASGRYGYTGRVHTSGMEDLAYYRARFYRADLGGFTAVDPLTLSGGLDLARYQYAAGDPVLKRDPLGLLLQGGAMQLGVGLGALASMLFLGLIYMGSLSMVRPAVHDTNHEMDRESAEYLAPSLLFLLLVFRTVANLIFKNVFLSLSFSAGILLGFFAGLLGGIALGGLLNLGYLLYKERIDVALYYEFLYIVTMFNLISVAMISLVLQTTSGLLIGVLISLFGIGLAAGHIYFTVFTALGRPVGLVELLRNAMPSL